MRKFVVTLMASLLSCATAFAFWPEAADSSLEIGVGYRQDELEWKTKADFDNYEGYDQSSLFGLSSHLKWRDLNIWQIEGVGKYVTCDNIYLRANGDYGWITSGKHSDRDSCDFYGNGSDFSSSDDHGSSNHVKGNVYDAKLAVGYQFRMCDNSFTFTPLIGYSWHGQHFKDHRNNDHYDNFNADTSDFAYGYSGYGHNKNHNKYHTRWNGPFVGFDFEYFFGCGCEQDWQIFGDYEFHWADFHAKGDFHSRTDLLNGFHQHAKNAYGHVFDIGVKWDFCECWTLALKGEFQWWWADKGHDSAKILEASFGDVETDCFVKIPLHDVKWHSAGVSLLVGMVF